MELPSSARILSALGRSETMVRSLKSVRQACPESSIRMFVFGECVCVSEKMVRVGDRLMTTYPFKIPVDHLLVVHVD